MTEPRKTVVIISPAFPENESATYWVPSQQLLVKAMKRNFPQYDFEVLTLLYPYQKGEYRWHDIPVTSYNGTKYPGPKRLLLWWKVWRKLKKIKQEKKLAGILSFWCMEAALVGTFFARRNNIPHYCWLCGQDARASNHYIKRIKPRANELIAISDFVAAEFSRNHHVKPAQVITNAIDTTMFPAQWPADRDIDILAVGALIPLKQYDKLIEITDKLRQHFPSLVVKIGGIGEEKDRLTRLIEQLGLNNNVELLGGIKHEAVLQLMQRTRLLIHPSSYEGFSTVCLEALYAGAQVISFVKPMNHDIKNWYIAGSTEDMTGKALELLSNPMNHERISTFSIDDTAKQMMQLFEPKA